MFVYKSKNLFRKIVMGVVSSIMRTQLKKILRFYFSAGSLNRALDGVITRLAASSWQDISVGEGTFERVNTVIAVKAELKDFWARLNAAMEKLPPNDLAALKKYAALRTGVSLLSGEDKRAIHSALVKFKRKTGVLLSSSLKAYKCVCAYYALISPTAD